MQISPLLTTTARFRLRFLRLHNTHRLLGRSLPSLAAERPVLQPYCICHPCTATRTCSSSLNRSPVSAAIDTVTRASRKFSHQMASVSAEGNATTQERVEAVRPPVKRRNVVSSFVLKEEEGVAPMIALFRRSEKVNTYCNRLGAVSGTIDAEDLNPEDAAWRELTEETTLTSQQVSLVRKGKPYTFGDASLNREWTIHPFLFKLHHPSLGDKIRIDWEHTDYVWLDPLKVPADGEEGAQEIVPKIAESLRRVYVHRNLGPRAGEVLAKGLQRLRDDHENGARVLGSFALDTLRDVISEMDPEVPTGGWWENVRMAGWHLWKNGRPAMDAAIRAVVIGGLSRVEPLLESVAGIEIFGAKRRDKVLSILASYAEERAKSVKGISQALTKYLHLLWNMEATICKGGKISILTLSSSSTLTAALRSAAKQLHPLGITLDIRVLESRPLFEGASVATSFASFPGTKVTVYPDCGAALAARGIDVVLLGADRISDSGAVSNKLGSLPAVLCAKHMEPEVRVVVLGEREKVALGEAHEEENDPTEVTAAWGSSASAVVNMNEAVHRVGDQNRNKLGITGDSQAKGPRRESQDGDGATTMGPDMGVAGARQDQQGGANSYSSSEEDVKILLEGSNGMKAGQVGYTKGAVTGQVQVRNVYFEWVPPELVDVYICETGVWEAREVRKRAEWVEEETERLFGGL